MAGEKMRYWIPYILRLAACFKIHFKLLNVDIHSWMWPFMANAIEYGTWCKVEIGGGNGFDGSERTFHFADEHPRPWEVVHEATHALIWVTHKGQDIRTGTHEAAAYLAETLFTIYDMEPEGSHDWSTQPRLEGPMTVLANAVVAGSKQGSHVVCSPPLVHNIIAVLRHNARGQDLDEVKHQYGIHDWDPETGEPTPGWLRDPRSWS
jgi:hypothetical protein